MDGTGQYTKHELADLLEWWVEAGVDVAVQEEPRDWLQPAARPATAAAPNVAGPSHETLAELHGWLASSLQLPLASPTARRILPHGPEDAEIMLLSDSPALEDFASGQPIGGDAWLLAGRMLAAIGMSVDAAYSASLSCFPATGTRMSEDDRAECAEIARKHIELPNRGGCPVRQRTLPGAAGTISGRSTRPRPQWRRRPHGGDLSSALAVAAPRRQGQGLERPPAPDGRLELIRLSLFAALLATSVPALAQADPLAPLTESEPDPRPLAEPEPEPPQVPAVAKPLVVPKTGRACSGHSQWRLGGSATGLPPSPTTC